MAEGLEEGVGGELTPQAVRIGLEEGGGEELTSQAGCQVLGFLLDRRRKYLYLLTNP